MSNRTRVIAVVAGFVVVALFLYMFLVKPRSSEVDVLNAQIATEESTMVTLRGQLDQLQALKENAPELEAELKQVRGLVPIKAQVDRFIDQVQKRAEQAGVEFIEISPEVPKSPPEGATLAEVRISIGATGQFFSLNDFVSLLYDLPRAMRIDLLSLEATEEGTGDRLLQLNATARIFFEIPAAGANPQNAPTPEQTPSGETS